MPNMTKEELMARVVELETALETEKSKSINMKDRVMAQLDAGVNTMNDMTTALDTTAKNISSILTALRKELIPNGKTIITQRHRDQVMLAVMDLEVLGWK